MDIVSFSIEAIILIFEVTRFIRDVTQDFKDYGDAKHDISEQLALKLVNVRFLRNDKVSDSVERDVHSFERISMSVEGSVPIFLGSYGCFPGFEKIFCTLSCLFKPGRAYRL